MRKPAPFGGKAYKRTVRDTKEERDLCYARLIDYKDHRKIEMFWDLNEETKRDVIFKLKIGGLYGKPGVEVLIDSEELMRFLRWV